MRPPPERIGAAKVVSYTPIDSRHKPTGACRHIVRGELLCALAGLIVSQYKDDKSFYLFYCDDDWNVLTDTWHETLEDALDQAEAEYVGTRATWERVV